MSKIKNSREMIKNWKENGTCEGFITLNPHSNGVTISFSGFLSFFVSVAKKSRIPVKIREILHMIEILIEPSVF